MGSVYDVEDVSVGKRYVLKTLHPQLIARQDLAKRMEAEARALAKLQHPNIVDVVTAGVTTDEQRMPFYVMERLNGQNLRVVIEKKGSLELSHCFRIAIDVLDALEHAHENSVIHRDVKPENIFLHRNTNGTTTTKLLDFGIMRLLDRKVSHTQGKFIGTLRYASPEQIFGGELGPATDIYSLGIVLYEMLAGRGPFDDVGDAYAIGAAHAQKPPPPLSTFVVASPALERLVMSSLAKDPAARPRDCFAFARELRLMLREEEAAPKSATAINVLSQVPQTRHQDPGAARLSEPSAELSATEVGMLPPSAVAPAGYAPGGALPATVRESAAARAIGASGGAGPGRDGAAGGMPHGAGPGGVAPGAGPGGVGHGAGPGGGFHGAGAGAVAFGPPGFRATGPTALGVAATLASVPGIAAVRESGARASSMPGGRPLVDRAAETRASGGSGLTQRLAQNGTAMDFGPPLLPDDAVRAALAQREGLEVPPSGGAHDARSGELVFPATHGYVTGAGSATGPLAGEALTRPPERSLVLPLVGAALLGAALVGGAVLAVTKPWVKRAAAPVASVVEPASSPPSAALAASPSVPATASAPAVASVAVPSVEPASAPNGPPGAGGATPGAGGATPAAGGRPLAPRGVALAPPAPAQPVARGPAAPAPSPSPSASAARKAAHPAPSGTTMPFIPFE
jgi:serine/threonine-protein kinase